MSRKEVVVQIAGGLEARPIAVLVQVASQYESSIYLEAGDKRVNAKSIMGMMTLGLNEGEKIVIEADGKDEAAAVEGVEKYITGQEA
ncbi:MAG: HPr family phosphocarrier protein [Lachnospiraceae bacterium]|nr:HPr family phosphocarrier protein [Lachnospiraceae bacterium]MCI7596390.1 HPr family phosphocarrier protein [Lachnospiraceae bacterium]MDD7051716.1 HPr family phosphocarrier protein [Lachnospiraceae bacterium]MDY3222693.1 HPr family phosphocarrier protein [Lachnospiraceae bacterium]MDY4095354.1 HPr family phosphocarrier protein [Lachnospiraceae bacterium]